MNAHQRALVRETYERLRPIPKAVGLQLYERLFEIDPSLRRLFKASPDNQAAMFVTVLNSAVLELVDDGVISSTLRDLGARHAVYGVTEPLYATFGDALLWTLQQQLGDRFTPEVREAWTEAYGELAEGMKRAAAEAEASAKQ